MPANSRAIQRRLLRLIRLAANAHAAHPTEREWHDGEAIKRQNLVIGRGTSFHNIRGQGHEAGDATVAPFLRE